MKHCEQGDRIERGRAYVAPPDVHMMFADGYVTLTRGARENQMRPAIDKLFRSAAAIHGSRTIGVLLTGMLDDGVAGVRAIREAGGFIIVQHPDDAAFPDLPKRALEAVAPDRVLPLDSIPTALLAAVQETADEHPVPSDIVLEAALDQQQKATPAQMALLGPQTSAACPECQGPMWRLGDVPNRRYRCYLGHVVTARQFLEQSALHVEAALWSAVRALDESATTLETLAHLSARRRNQPRSLVGRDVHAPHSRDTSTSGSSTPVHVRLDAADVSTRHTSRVETCERARHAVLSRTTRGA